MSTELANFDSLHANGELTIMDLARRCGNEVDAWLLLEELRWGKGAVNVACAHCGCTDVHFIKPSNGATRRTASESQSARRVWKCHKRGGGCGRQFTATVGTVMHRTKMPIATWLFVMFEMVASKNGVAAREIQRKYKVSHKAAWHMLMRIREAMSNDGLAAPMTGRVAVDETFVGGKAKSMNKKRKKAFREEFPNSLGGTNGKTPVVTMINRDTGEVRSRVVNDVTGATLRKHLDNNVIKSETDLETDQYKGYKQVGQEMRSHKTVDHSKNIYGMRGVSTNVVESYFSQLKRSIDGTHHHCSSVHLQRYVGEFDYRYTTRKLNDSQRLQHLLGRSRFASPLPYSALLAGSRKS